MGSFSGLWCTSSGEYLFLFALNFMFCFTCIFTLSLSLSSVLGTRLLFARGLDRVADPCRRTKGGGKWGSSPGLNLRSYRKIKDAWSQGRFNVFHRLVSEARFLNAKAIVEREKSAPKDNRLKTYSCLFFWSVTFRSRQKRWPISISAAFNIKFSLLLHLS